MMKPRINKSARLAKIKTGYTKAYRTAKIGRSGKLSLLM